MRVVAMIINTLIFAVSISALPGSNTHGSQKGSVAKQKVTYASILPKSLKLKQKCGGFGKSITINMSRSIQQAVSSRPEFQWKLRNATVMDKFHWSYGNCTAQAGDGLSFFSVNVPILGDTGHKHLLILATGKSIDDSVNFKVCVAYLRGADLKRKDNLPLICNSPRANIKTIGDALPDSLKKSFPDIVCGHKDALVKYSGKSIIKQTLNNGVVGLHSADFYAVTKENGDFETKIFFEDDFGAEDCQRQPGLFQVVSSLLTSIIPEIKLTRQLTTTVEYDKKKMTLAILTLAATKQGVSYLQARDKLGEPDRICGFLLEYLTGKLSVNGDPELAVEHCIGLPPADNQ